MSRPGPARQGRARNAVLCTPLRVEQAMLRGAGRSMRLVRTGMGPQRAAATAATLAPAPALVAGVAGSLAPHVRPGDVVVATEVRALSLPNLTAGLFTRSWTTLLFSSGRRGLVDGTCRRSVGVPSAALLAGALRRLGLTVHLGPISSVSRIAWGAVADDGSLAVDMESAQLARPDAPFAVVRAIVDTPDHPLWRLGTLRRGVTALRALRACRPALEWWAAATGPREVLLVEPGAIAGQVDLVLVVGSADSLRLVQGVPAHLVNDVSEIDLRWLAGPRRVGILADAGAAPQLVDQIVHCLGGLGPVRVDVTVALSPEVNWPTR